MSRSWPFDWSNAACVSTVTGLRFRDPRVTRAMMVVTEVVVVGLCIDGRGGVGGCDGGGEGDNGGDSGGGGGGGGDNGGDRSNDGNVIYYGGGLRTL